MPDLSLTIPSAYSFSCQEEGRYKKYIPNLLSEIEGDMPLYDTVDA